MLCKVNFHEGHRKAILHTNQSCLYNKTLQIGYINLDTQRSALTVLLLQHKIFKRKHINLSACDAAIVCFTRSKNLNVESPF